MKKIKLLFIVLLCSVCVFALAACGSTEEALNEEVIKSASKSYISFKGENEVGVIVDENEKVEEVISEDLTEEEKETLENEVTGKELEEAIDDIIEEVVDENDENPEVIIDAENEDEEVADELTQKVKAIVEAVLASKGVDANVSVDTLEEYAKLALELGVSEEQAKLIVLAITLNPTLTFEDVKDLSMSVLIALCNKQEEKITYASYKTYLNALEALYEEYNYVFELEDKVYELTFKLLEDLSDEEFDATCAELKQSKADYKEGLAKMEAAIEELDALYANVLEGYKEEKSGKCDKDDKEHHSGKTHHGHDSWFEYDFDDEDDEEWYEYDFEDEDYEEWLEQFFDEWDFDWEDFFKDFEVEEDNDDEEATESENNENDENDENEETVEKDNKSHGWYSYDYSYNYGESHGHHGHSQDKDSNDSNDQEDSNKNGDTIVASYKGYRF